jgi:putative hydrolase of the HAD superfamily
VNVEWVFLDLDNTLWDFDGNAEEALKVLFEKHRIEFHTGYKVEQFVALYRDVNHAYWARYERGEVDKETLRTKRFSDTFDLMGLPHALQPENVWQEYLDICPLMKKMMPGAIDCLKLLSEKFKIGILTNGFEQTQTIKLKESGIGFFVDYMQSSERVGIAKPSKDFFNLALNSVSCDVQNAVYIGDNFQTDVLGGLQSGIKTYWYRLSGDLQNTSELLEFGDLYGGEVSDLCHWAQTLNESQNN